MLRFLVVLIAAGYANVCCAAWREGEVMPFPQCSPQELLIQDTDFRRFYNLWYYDKAFGQGSALRFAITCLPVENRTTGTLYVIDPDYDFRLQTIKSYKVTRVVRPDDPARLLIEQRRDDAMRAIVEDSTNSMNTSALLYTQRDTQRCPKRAEIVSMALGERMSKSLVGVAKPSGICVAAEERFGSGGIAPLNLLDWGFREDGSVRLVAQVESARLLVLEYLLSGELKVLAELSDPELFPNGCGMYLTSARLLPRSTRVALAFRTPRLYTIDYANPREKPRVLYDWLQLMTKEVAFTCEGRLASYGAERDRLWISPLQPSAEIEQKLHFLALDGKYQPLLLSFPL